MLANSYHDLLLTRPPLRQRSVCIVISAGSSDGWEPPQSAWASMLRAIELARDEPSVPSQNGIRQSDSRYIAERLAG
jgi:hypothetical protein